MGSMDAWARWMTSGKIPVLLDGSLGETMISRGHNLKSTRLWAGSLLQTDPEALKKLAVEYLDAGADIVTTATYQSTSEGISTEFGVSRVEADKLLQSATRLVHDARDQYWGALSTDEKACRRHPIVAASLGPMAAILPNESEYEGTYTGMTRNLFVEFHKRRARTVSVHATESKSRPDVLAFETIPSRVEAQAIASVMSAPDMQPFPYWISFQCRDAQSIANGERLDVAVGGVLSACGGAAANLVALGVNCVHPESAASLVGIVQAACSNFMRGGTRPPWALCTVAYANDGAGWSGVGWDASRSSSCGAWAQLALECGASIVGGCCRTGPAHIRQLDERRQREKEAEKTPRSDAIM